MAVSAAPSAAGSPGTFHRVAFATVELQHYREDSKLRWQLLQQRSNKEKHLHSSRPFPAFFFFFWVFLTPCCFASIPALALPSNRNCQSQHRTSQGLPANLAHIELGHRPLHPRASMYVPRFPGQHR